MRVFIADHGSITTKDVTLREDSQYPSYVHQIDSFARRVKTTMRIPTQNMIDGLLNKYQHLYRVAGGGRTGLLVGSGASGWGGTGITMTEAEPDYSTRLGFLQLVNIQAGMVAKRLGIEDYLATDATSCSSSLKCIEDAVSLINSERVDRLLILGWDDQISSPVLNIFNGLKASLSKKCYENGRRPSAFDGKNGGFLIGHGIGFLVIESERVVSSPVAEILCQCNVSGYPFFYRNITRGISHTPGHTWVQPYPRAHVDSAIPKCTLCLNNTEVNR
jgi:3-oxoacyl-(acyl-carrier-protein) synthase